VHLWTRLHGQALSRQGKPLNPIPLSPIADTKPVHTLTTARILYYMKW
jgi:hypothetical protein